MNRLIIAIGVLAAATSAYATPPCNQFFAQKYVAPVYAAVQYAPVQYLAGQDIQAEALAERVARLVDKRLSVRIQQLSQQQVAPKPATMLSQHCAKCHSGATPKGGLTFDGLTPVPPELALAALRSIRDEVMPKDHKVPPEVKGALMEELLSLDASAQQRPATLPAPVKQEPEFVPPPPDGGLR